MEQMNLENYEVILVDYDTRNLSPVIQLFQPAIYKDGTCYCCVMGPDPQAGIFGCGDTPKEALEDWAAHFTDTITARPKDDALVRYVYEKLGVTSSC